MANIFVHLWLACLKLIFTFLHLTFSGLKYFDLVWSLFKRKLDSFFGASIGNTELCISRCMADLEKKPRHLALILGSEAIRCEEITNLIIWCLAAGISFLSIYDYSGRTRENEAKLYEHVLQHVKTTNSHVKFRNLPAKNGIKKHYRNNIFVSILSEIDGKENFSNLVRRFCGEIKAGLRKPSEISIDTLNSEVKSDSQFPDPDLGVIVGPAVSTYGFPPWQIPVTEFVCIPTMKNFQIWNFCSLLKSYSSCQQRFGK